VSIVNEDTKYKLLLTTFRAQQFMGGGAGRGGGPGAGAGRDGGR